VRITAKQTSLYAQHMERLTISVVTHRTYSYIQTLQRELACCKSVNTIITTLFWAITQRVVVIFLSKFRYDLSGPSSGFNNNKNKEIIIIIIFFFFFFLALTFLQLLKVLAFSKTSSFHFSRSWTQALQFLIFIWQMSCLMLSSHLYLGLPCDFWSGVSN
jgi:hypothetical protein